MAWGFSFIVPERLAGMGAPRDPDAAVDWLQQQGVRNIVSLTHPVFDPDRLNAAGFGYLHLPVEDFTAPELDQIERFVQFVDEAPARGATVVHCTAGMGRTGTMLACYLVHQGYDPDRAIAEVRALRPGSIETSEQSAIIHRYAQARGRGLRE
jgi:atypical dual specificity phosphatase